MFDAMDATGLDSLKVSAAAPVSVEEHPMVRPTDVTALEGYRIWIRYSDGSAGEVNLAHLAGHGVFSAWDDRRYSEDVHLGPGGAIAWGEDIELCPDALYIQVTGRPLEEVMSGITLQTERA